MLVPEMKLFAPEYRLCGCADIIAVGDTPNGIKLLDYKRSKHTCRPDEYVFGKKYGYGPCSGVKANSHGKYTVQLNLYRVLLQKYYGVVVESMHLVRMYPGLKSYELIEVPNIEGVIHEMLAERQKEVRLLRLFRAAGAAVQACWRLRRGPWRRETGVDAPPQDDSVARELAELKVKYANATRCLGALTAPDADARAEWDAAVRAAKEADRALKESE